MTHWNTKSLMAASVAAAAFTVGITMATSTQAQPTQSSLQVAVTLAQDSKSDKATVAGRVTRDGRPVSDVFIRVVVPQDPPKPSRAPSGGGGNLTSESIEFSKSGRGRVVASGKSDEGGKYSIAVPPGKYKIVAGNKNTGVAEVDIEVKAGESITRDLQLQKQ